MHDEPGPPSARRPGLPGRLDQNTARLLAKDPADRPASASAARARLLAAVNRDATAKLPPLASDQAPGLPASHRRWRPRVTEVVLAVALAAALAGLAAVLLTGTAPGSSAGAPVTRPPTHPARCLDGAQATRGTQQEAGQAGNLQQPCQRAAPGRRRSSRVRRRPAGRSG